MMAYPGPGRACVTAVTLGAMSRENVETVRRAYDALRRRDLHAVLDVLDPEVEATSRLADAEGTVYRGREGVRRMIDELLSVFPDWAPEVVDARDLGHSVVAELRVVGRAVGSGITVGDTAWQVLEFRDGKVVQLHGYGSEAEALAAAGGQEPT
jgi:ketosteroid isomerase-like protein